MHITEKEMRKIHNALYTAYTYMTEMVQYIINICEILIWLNTVCNKSCTTLIKQKGDNWINNMYILVYNLLICGDGVGMTKVTC